jgi:hypothetical protein
VVKPEVDASDRAPWGVLASAAGSCGALALVNALAMGTVAVVAAPILALTLRPGFNADPVACMAVACVVVPMQSAVVLLAGVVGATVAGGVGWLSNALLARRRAAAVPGCLLAVIPTVSASWLGVFLAGVATGGNCCVTCCGSLWFASFLADRYDWPTVNAEYYAQRRCAPCMFYGLFALTEVALVAVMASGNAVSVALLSGWAGLTGRPTAPGESLLEPDLLWVPPPDPVIPDEDTATAPPHSQDEDVEE